MNNKLRELRAGELLRTYGRRIVGAGIVLCLLGLAVSFIRPKQQLQTVTINMSAEGEQLIPMEPGTTLSYQCGTRGYPLAGIQVGIGKNGREIDTGYLHVWVYDAGRETLYSESLISMADIDDGQYVYIPFDNYRQCIGELYVLFAYEAEQGTAEYPGIYVNSARTEDASTYVNEELLDGSLKCYYVYRVDYYPLLYDLCLLLFILAGVFFLTEKGARRKRKEKTEDNMPEIENRYGGRKDETSAVR